MPAATAHRSGLAPLNPEQQRAATWGSIDERGRFTSGPLLVIAGAGTGKTEMLAARVAHLVTHGVDPARILLLTFSRRAAAEMVRRAGRMAAVVMRAGAVGPALRLPWAGTFHAVAVRVLRAQAARLGLDPAFTVLDRGDATDLIDLLRHELGLAATLRRFPRKDTCAAIFSALANGGGTLREVLARDWPWCLDAAEPLQALLDAYTRRKAGHGVLDFDDLLVAWDAAMADPALAAVVGGWFDHVLVDEYQDTNRLQARILHALRPDGRGVVVVGDDAQSIYRFRGADVGNILAFPGQFEPPAERVVLERNYRSVQPVLDAANALMDGAARAWRKALRAERGAGARPVLATVDDELAQADRVIRGVLAEREAGVPLKRQAVLFRSAHHSDALEVELVRRNVPYVKHGGLRFLDAAHVKDLLAVLRWAEQPRDALAGFRVLQLPPGMGPAHARRALDAAAAGGFAALPAVEVPAAARPAWAGLCALLAALAEPAAPWRGQVAAVRAWYGPVLAQRHPDAAVRAGDLDMLEAVSARFGSRERFLTELALDPPSAAGDEAGAPHRDEDWLVLSTVHSAKGQEWDAVWVLAVNDGNFPNEYATGSQEGIDEERRLLYVAMTRARDRLELLEQRTWRVTQQRRFGDTHVLGARSRFLDAAVLARLDRTGADEPAPADAALPAP